MKPPAAAIPADAVAALQAVEQRLIRGDFAAALSTAQQLVQVAPDNAKAQRLLGAALAGLGRRAEALHAFERALARAPEDALIHNSLATILLAEGQRERALAAFRRATELAPDLAPAWYNLSLLQMIENRPEAALVAIDRVLALAPRLLPARVQRGSILLALGREDEAIAEYRRARDAHPDAVQPWLGLAGLKRNRFSPAEVERLGALNANPAIAERDRAALGFVLAQALDDQGRYAEAYAALDGANAGVRRHLPWDGAAHSTQVDAILGAFAQPAAVHAAVGDPQQGASVIFVVSLPRAGSTLIEQILASHPDVEGAGELDDLENVLVEESQRRGVPFARWASQASAEDWRRLGAEYLVRTARWRARKPYFTDKLPGNWRNIGAIRRMLPAARIVVCARDLIETALSCWRQHFGGSLQPWSYDLASIGAYLRDFERACAHWQHLEVGAMRVQSYEALLADPEGQTRALLAFCGLDWDPACLQFHRTQRNVTTLSASQVREPLRRDTARAAKYGSLLDPLRAALGLPPFAQKRT
ncbi:MAG: tetratricopeptide repeat protein [Gammaproteobacteria bacterium]|nr:MAG: tetratricopeptide repeat protein [Gammaproteobacteria bacterium]